ncbi:hypothetical protein K461DRAFT_276037 [Myriangium duriaei CBS 260.36]|uniref:Rhodopsin domain-containing protein n=1 Tax=Myriangium duriaei CBS 260.36 TaxID=1168546 RepID=A0A9P4MJ22_9PEZI|nr:hypothetical protein K461DRAFT_276037 [Myriangium duriaei CBS 260.36]
MSSPMALPVDPSKDTTEGLIYLINVCTTVTAILLALTSITVALRVFVRTKVVKTFGYDDATMIAAQIAFTVTAILTFIFCYCAKVLVSSGKFVIPLEPLVQVIRYSNAIYTLTMILMKVSVAIFFLKLFAISFKWQRMSIIILTGISIAMGLAYLIFTIASCGIMVQSQKTTPLKTGTDWCPTQQIFVDFSIAWSFINAITDFVFAGLAVNVIWGAKMNRSTKISAAVLVCLGCIGSIASCARIAVQLPLGDIRMAGVLLGIWSNVEAGVCITAASLITLRPLFQTAIDRARSTLGSLKATSGISKSYGSSHSRASSTSSKKEVMEMINLESGLSLDKSSGVTVTRTWQTQTRDADAWSN